MKIEKTRTACHLHPQHHDYIYTHEARTGQEGAHYSQQRQNIARWDNTGLSSGSCENNNLLYGSVTQNRNNAVNVGSGTSIVPHEWYYVSCLCLPDTKYRCYTVYFMPSLEHTSHRSVKANANEENNFR